MTPADTDSRPPASPEHLARWETRAREFLERRVPRAGDVDEPDTHSAAAIGRDKLLQLDLHAAGYAALTQPVEYGGQGLGEEESRIWQRLSADYAVPRMTFLVSHGMCGPIIDLLGTEEQKRAYLPDLWSGRTIFAQMFSEPGAGSDLAALQTKAEKVTGGWRLTGQKVWTSLAQHCEYGIILARTDPAVPKHRGITMFILDLRVPEVQVSPLRVADGEYPFNEVFLDGAFVPDANVLGTVNEGWSAAMAMLRLERISLGTGNPTPHGPLSFDRLVALARDGGLAEDSVARTSLAEVSVLERGTQALARLMREQIEVGQDVGARGSIAKLAGALASIRIHEMAADIVGLGMVTWADARDDYPDITKAITQGPAEWTAGGTIEIQKNIVGERVLGLEREPALDRDVPFRDARRSGGSSGADVRSHG
ncbi:acyl-CoA dehydrogenase family protein [Microbacterium sp. NPDC058062]|uniref:acyl-CoA dehydrogenase family protein n=1 Tax=Microbacterium sp. NPDC058062 TaxID=3346320 RepID=UPI0036DE4D65